MMKLVSSKMTFFNKRILPTIWFGFLAFFFVLVFIKVPNNAAKLPFVIFPLVMAAFGYVLMKKLCFDLLDEVYDNGGSLVLKNGGQEDVVSLSDILNVSYSALSNPQVITLSLKKPCKFGTEVSFGGPMSFVPFQKSPLVTELIDRINAARGG